MSEKVRGFGKNYLSGKILQSILRSAISCRVLVFLGLRQNVGLQVPDKKLSDCAWN